MKSIASAALLLLCSAASLAAQQVFTTPKAVLQALYAPYLAGREPKDTGPFFSDALTRLYEVDREKSQGEVGALGFDPVIDGQDGRPKGLVIEEPVVKARTATARVRFSSLGRRVVLDYRLVEEKGNWQVDDIERRGGPDAWRLTEIFKTAGD